MPEKDWSQIRDVIFLCDGLGFQLFILNLDKMHNHLNGFSLSMRL